MSCSNILVEGAIGCGKTTFLNNIANESTLKYLDIQIINEPVQEWCNSYKEDLLEKFTTDMNNEAAMFQMLTQLTIGKMIPSCTTRAITLRERSIFSANKVFAKALTELGYIKPHHKYIIDKQFDILRKEEKLSGIIYLDCDTKLAFKRVKERNHPTDRKLTLEYMTIIKQYYDNWISSLDIPMITCDTSKPYNPKDSLLEIMRIMNKHQ